MKSNKLKLVIASGNAHKLEEIREILEDAGVGAAIKSMKEAGADIRIKEDGKTFEANAQIKAKAVHDALVKAGKLRGMTVLADDSGLEIDALKGEPGIHSARYLGEKTPHEAKCADILRRMEKVAEKKRTARFVCAVCAVFPDGSQVTVRGVLEGRIAREPRGTGGFGYDPIFYLPERCCTNAELTPEEKNRISHRGRAFREAATILMLKQNT
ncbi:MAG: RdgB/HAM1 family non-canonical purine NTP pyrophosphatase [Lachnospiraceae bacterium]|nr:RdgB/HAM1 family non-canonical purine NTP pyrophosphatase [Lachnospiraceae bacterium]